MKLERTDTEIVVRIPASVDLTELQDLLDYLKYKELTSRSEATQTDIDELTRSANKSIWDKIKNRHNSR